MKKLSILLALLMFSLQIHASEICQIISGAKIIAQDSNKTYLGKITNSYDSDSIFNTYGNFGGEYSATSIWNNYGTFGGSYNRYSPFNKYTLEPPMLIKNGTIIGYLSVNKYNEPAINPNLIKALCEDQL